MEEKNGFKALCINCKIETKCNIILEVNKDKTGCFIGFYIKCIECKNILIKKKMQIAIILKKKMMILYIRK